MTTLRFVFDKEKVVAAGKTEDELLAPMREHATRYGIDEPEYGFFTKDGEDAMCVITMFVANHTAQNLDYVSYLKEWTLDVDGDVEDCIEETLDWYREKGIRSGKGVEGGAVDGA